MVYPKETRRCFDIKKLTHRLVSKHAESFKTNFDPDVRDGWYQPGTGGNFNYGIVSGYSFGQSDITFKIGMVLSQDLKTTPFVPFYAQLGYNFRFGGK